MKLLYSTAALLILGLGTPLLMQAIDPLVAVANSHSPEGTFIDRDWTISIFYENNTYHYTGLNNQTQSSIQLSGAALMRDRQRRIYTWNNSGTRYQVVWQPQDPNFIRVRVTGAKGREILNRLLRRRSAEGDI